MSITQSIQKSTALYKSCLKNSLPIVFDNLCQYESEEYTEIAQSTQKSTALYKSNLAVFRAKKPKKFQKDIFFLTLKHFT